MAQSNQDYALIGELAIGLATRSANPDKYVNTSHDDTSSIMNIGRELGKRHSATSSRHSTGWSRT
jgi:hypothetical protein